MQVYLKWPQTYARTSVTRKVATRFFADTTMHVRRHGYNKCKHQLNGMAILRACNLCVYALVTISVTIKYAIVMDIYI